MELFIAAAGAAGLLVLIAFLSPAIERERRPIRSMVGRDLHARRMGRASLAAQVAQRKEPRPLRVSGDTIRPMEATLIDVPAAVPAAPFLASAAAPRLDWARQVSDSSTRGRRERNADSLVASLLKPGVHAR